MFCYFVIQYELFLLGIVPRTFMVTIVLPMKLKLFHYFKFILFSKKNSTKREVIVLDSDALATEPESTLKQLCQDLDIPFDPTMLSWKSGSHDCDGPWADWWYGNVHQSSGWFSNSDKDSSLVKKDSSSNIDASIECIDANF